MLQATAVDAPTTTVRPAMRRMPAASREPKPGSEALAFRRAGLFDRLRLATKPGGVGLSETSKSSGGALTALPWMLGRGFFTVPAPSLPERASRWQRLGGFC